MGSSRTPVLCSPSGAGASRLVGVWASGLTRLTHFVHLHHSHWLQHIVPLPRDPRTPAHTHTQQHQRGKVPSHGGKTANLKYELYRFVCSARRLQTETV